MKPITPLLACALSLFFISCSEESSTNKTDSAAETSTNTVTKPEGPDCWSKAAFQNIDLGEDDLGVPRTIVQVMVCDKLVAVDTVTGRMELYSPNAYVDMDIPAEASAACGGWFAGGGDYFYILPDSDGVEVFHGWQDEGVDTPGYHWEKVKEVR